jgi:hypothetical protein
MTDTRVKDLLDSAIGHVPPATFDLDRAMRTGRRRRRARTTSTLVACAAVLAAIGGSAMGINNSRSAPSALPAASGPDSSASTPALVPSALATLIGQPPVDAISLPADGYTLPADVAAIRLADPAPGFPYRSFTATYAVPAPAGGGPLCYTTLFLVSTLAGPPQPVAAGTGHTASVRVTDCSTPAPAGGTATANPPVAGVTGQLVSYPPEPGASSTDPTLSLYFTTGKFTATINGTGLTTEQLVGLGNALTGLK